MLLCTKVTFISYLFFLLLDHSQSSLGKTKSISEIGNWLLTLSNENPMKPLSVLSPSFPRSLRLPPP